MNRKRCIMVMSLRLWLRSRIRDCSTLEVKTGQHSQRCGARRINRTCTQSMRRPTGKCLHWHFQPLPDRIYNTYMFQEDHHSPCAQGSQSNLPKWLPPLSTHVGNLEVLWKAGHGSHQQHPPGSLDPLQFAIPPQQIHRWHNLNHTPHCPFPPGQQEHLCENAVHWLQLSVQHHSAQEAHH